MRTLRDIGLLATNNARSKAYVQYLLRAGLRPAGVILLTPPPSDSPSRLLPGQRPEDLADRHRTVRLPAAGAFFDPDVSLTALLDEFDVPWREVEAETPNDAAVCDAVRSGALDTVIYSGPGGAIIRKPLFDAGSRLLHVHGGTLPAFRGSTTIYYEILATGRCAATAIFLEEQIDTGPVLHHRSFDVPRSAAGGAVDLDYVFDSHCRATVLVETIELYLEHGKFRTVPQETTDEPPYYIIHPVLRQAVRLSLGIAKESGSWRPQEVVRETS